MLWGDDGKPLGLVEAKRTKVSAEVGQQQAKLYADCLEATYGQRPVIFYTNGYETWLWDDQRYPPRLVQGFYKKSELDPARCSDARASKGRSRRRRSKTENSRAATANARHPPHRRDVRAGPPAEGVGRDGDGGGQDPHRHRPLRCADALQLGRSAFYFWRIASRS